MLALQHNDRLRPPQQKNIELQTSACNRGNSRTVAADAEGTPLPDRISLTGPSMLLRGERNR